MERAGTLILNRDISDDPFISGLCDEFDVNGGKSLVKTEMATIMNTVNSPHKRPEMYR